MENIEVGQFQETQSEGMRSQEAQSLERRFEEKQSMEKQPTEKQSTEKRQSGDGLRAEENGKRPNDAAWQNLARAALEARKRAYAPYSHYTVGAALLTESGGIYQGGNIENASYGATNCAERTAIYKAVSEGERKVRAIAIAGGMEGEEPTDYAYPCGICRQVMQEFAGEDFVVIVVRSVSDYQVYGLRELLPYGFGGDSIR